MEQEESEDRCPALVSGFESLGRLHSTETAALELRLPTLWLSLNGRRNNLLDLCGFAVHSTVGVVKTRKLDCVFGQDVGSCIAGCTVTAT